MSARILWSGSDRQESEKLKPFLPIARYFAALWERTVVMNAAGGAFQPFDTGDAGRKIYIHFYSSPLENARQVEPLAEAFFFSVPSSRIKMLEDDALEGHDIASCVEHSAEGTIIRSPQSQKAVAEIRHNHVYILFDLAYREWDAAVPVFYEILERATPSLVPSLGERNNEAKTLALSLKAHEALRGETIRRKKGLMQEFDRVSRLILEREMEKVRENLAERRRALETLEEQSSELAVRIAMLQEIMNDPTKDEDLSDERLIEEFEALHRFKNMRGIEVRGDALHVFTEPIEHIATNGERRMLSQYEIIIKPWEGGKTRNGNRFNAIQMKEHGWIGPYYHPEETLKNSAEYGPRPPCFGGQFVTSVEKALLDHDYVVLVELLLHYLDSDNRRCPERPQEKQSKEAYRATPFYVSEDARRRTRDEYVNFVRRFRGAFRKEAFQKELSSAAQEERQVSENVAKAREQAALLSARLQFLSFYAQSLPVADEFETLLAIPALSAIHTGKHFIWILFGPGRGEGEFANLLFPGSFRMLIEPLKGRVRVMGGSFDGNSFVRHRVRDGGLIIVSGYSSNAMSYVAKALLGRAIKEFHDVLRGKTVGDSRKHELLTKEVVEEYLRKHGFPEVDYSADPWQIVDPSYC